MRGNYKHKVTTEAPEAQRYFNQGLAFYHGFIPGLPPLPAAGGRARSEIRHGALGHRARERPHINLPTSAACGRAGLKERQLGQECHRDFPGRARLSKRSASLCQPQPEDSALLDQATDEMRKVWQNHLRIPVGVLFAEARWICDRRINGPRGSAQSRTEEVLATLETVLKMSPQHR